MKIIAETASNHMGDIEYLKKLTYKVVENGADIVTFQLFNLSAFLTKSYGNYNLFEKIEIPKDDWLSYIRFCEKKSINILPCILDPWAMEFCVDIGIKSVKIHSTDILNRLFLQQVDSLFDEVFLELGGATIDEIQNAVRCFSKARVVLIYGFNARPTELKNQNLSFLSSLSQLFGAEIGFADHTTETAIIPLMAMLQGANYLEKHVTLDKHDKERLDYEVSVEPQDLLEIKKNIEKYCPALGEKIRIMSESEQNFRAKLYKRIVASRDIESGETISVENITFKRAYGGMFLDRVNDILGLKVTKTIKKDNSIFLGDLQ